MNDHPATTPICGWLLPNNLDSSLMVYDAQGKGLGIIDVQAQWRSMPGSDLALDVEGIQNPYLKRMVRYLTAQGPAFVTAFLSAVDNALETIDPESFAQNEGLALLMGSPIALVRASLSLELQGLPVDSQNADALYTYTRTQKRTTDAFEQVSFPIRIGEYAQLNDGLVGYWKENADGSYADNIFYAPQSQSVENDKIVTHADGPVVLERSVHSSAQNLAILLDPRAQIHATTGILPTKSIDIPPDQYAAALQAIEVTFLSTPILTNPDVFRLPLPEEPGYAWSWLEKQGTQWLSPGSTLPFDPYNTFAETQSIREGWLKLSQTNL